MHALFILTNLLPLPSYNVHNYCSLIPHAVSLWNSELVRTFYICAFNSYMHACVCSNLVFIYVLLIQFYCMLVVHFKSAVHGHPSRSGIQAQQLPDQCLRCVITH